MLFVRYVLSFLHWNDLFSNQTPLDSLSHTLTCAYYRLLCFLLEVFIHTLCYLGYIPERNSMFNSKTRFVMK